MDRIDVVRRVLDRYLVEIVEAYDLCPWARTARTSGELAIEVVWGTPDEDDFVFHGEHVLAREGVKVAMIVAPELTISRDDWRAFRDRVAARLPNAGVADFHPAAPLELGSPAKLVPFLRRSPDPLLQCVPLALLDEVRAAPPAADLAQQAQMLGGLAQPPRGDVADRIARANHARVSASAAELTAKLADIARDRDASYTAAGIRGMRS